MLRRSHSDSDQVVRAPGNLPVRRQKAVRYLLRLLVGGALLYWLISAAGLQQLGTSLREIAPAQALLAFLLAIAGQAMTAARLKTLACLHSIRIDFASAIATNLASVFYGLFLPAGNVVGWVLRVWRLSGDSPHLKSVALMVLSDRMVATAGGAMVGMACWLLDYAHAPPVIGGLLVVVLVTSVVGWLGLSNLLARVVDWMLEGIPLLRIGRSGSNHALSADVSRLGPAGTFTLLAQSVAAHLAGSLAWYVAGIAAGLDLAFVTVAWIRSAVLAATLVPITISGLGVREAIIVMLLASFGIPGHKALAWSLQLFAITTVAVALLGGLLEARRILRPGVNG